MNSFLLGTVVSRAAPFPRCPMFDSLQWNLHLYTSTKQQQTDVLPVAVGDLHAIGLCEGTSALVTPVIAIRMGAVWPDKSIFKGLVE